MYDVLVVCKDVYDFFWVGVYVYLGCLGGRFFGGGWFVEECLECWDWW